MTKSRIKRFFRIREDHWAQEYERVQHFFTNQGVSAQMVSWDIACRMAALYHLSKTDPEGIWETLSVVDAKVRK